MIIPNLCARDKPIYVSGEDVLADGIVRRLLDHNESGARIRGWHFQKVSLARLTRARNAISCRGYVIAALLAPYARFCIHPVHYRKFMSCAAKFAGG